MRDQLTDEHRRKISETMTGMVRGPASDEHRRALSDAVSATYATLDRRPRPCPHCGRPFVGEHGLKIHTSRMHQARSTEATDEGACT